MLLQTREKEAEEGRSEQHAGDHFADDLWLPDAPSERADDPTNSENHEHLQEEGNGELGTGHDVGAE